jgi:hypothetical protein
MSIDPSAGPTYRQWTDEWWENVAGPEIVRCVGHKKNGNRCKHAALNGANVCAYHGGRAPQVQQRAKVRIQMATEMAAKELLGMAADTSIPEGVRLSAIKDILDRGGLSIRQGVDIEVSAKPFEKVFTKIVSGPRTIEGEIVEEPEEEQAGSLKARLLMRNEVDEYSDVVPRVEDLNGDSNG